MKACRQLPVERHIPPGPHLPLIARALHKMVPFLQDRLKKMRDLIRIILVITGHDDQNIIILTAGIGNGGADPGPDPGTPCMTNGLDPA